MRLSAIVVSSVIIATFPVADADNGFEECLRDVEVASFHLDWLRERNMLPQITDEWNGPGWLWWENDGWQDTYFVFLETSRTRETVTGRLATVGCGVNLDCLVDYILTSECEFPITG